MKRGKLDINAAPWVILREVERRWEDDPFYRTMRNIVAFHVDPDMTEKGLDALAQQERVVLVRGEGRPQRHTFLSVGLEALFMGSTMDLGDFEKFMASVGNDQAWAAPSKRHSCWRSMRLVYRFMKNGQAHNMRKEPTRPVKFVCRAAHSQALDR